jgi:hypothetical protein
MKVVVFAAGLLLQVPWLVLWAITASSTQGSRGPGSMGLVLPAIICVSLWFAGGVINGVLLVMEIVNSVKARAGLTRWMKILGTASFLWLVATLYFALR